MKVAIGNREMLEKRNTVTQGTIDLEVTSCVSSRKTGTYNTI